MDKKYYKILIYRGIPEATKVCTGDPNIKYSKSPDEKGIYDLYQIVDKNFNNISYKWEKSQYDKPHVFYWGKWHPVDSNYC